MLIDSSFGIWRRVCHSLDECHHVGMHIDGVGLWMEEGAPHGPPVLGAFGPLVAYAPFLRSGEPELLDTRLGGIDGRRGQELVREVEEVVVGEVVGHEAKALAIRLLQTCFH